MVAVVATIVAVLGGVAVTDGGATNAAFTAAVANPTNTAAATSSFTRTTLPFRDDFAGGQGGWTTYGGCWSTSTSFGYGKMLETCGGDGGPKAVTGNPAWTDYTVQADVQVNSGTQAGLLFRVTAPSNGTDAFKGYYASIDRSDGSLVLGRMDNGSYTSLGRRSIASGIGQGAFYHVVVQAVGCTFTVWQTTTGANTWTSLSYTDPSASCYTAGAIGLRDMSSTAGFRFVTVTANGTTAATEPWNSTLSTGVYDDGAAGTTYGGTWAIDQQREAIGVNPQESVGDKDVLNRTWTDMAMTGDVRLTGAPAGNNDAGFVVRVSNPSRGLDSIQGFYAGISGVDLRLGRQDNGWFDVTSTALPRGPQQNEWWHLTVAVTGCTVTATASPAAGGTITQVSSTFANCTTTTGAVGIRTNRVTAEWRNLAVTPR